MPDAPLESMLAWKLKHTCMMVQPGVMYIDNKIVYIMVIVEVV